jgi:thiamine biosynthesis lipoprotein
MILKDTLWYNLVARMPNPVTYFPLRFIAATLIVGISSTNLLSADTRSRPFPVTVTRSQYLMGTLAEITAVAVSDGVAQDAVTAGFQEIRRLEELFSTWLPTSELSGVNAAAGRDFVAVSHETFELLERSIEISELTRGAFDITVGPAVRLWKVTEADRHPTPLELEITAQYVDYHLLRLDAETQAVLLQKPGMQLDVGGIGKGYAAERAVAVMKKAGATGALVAISGDFRIFGHRGDGSAWPVGIQDPRHPDKVLITLESVDEAVSTSGDYERFFFKDGVRYHHILDPTTLMPARRCQSVTIVGSDATTADGLATGVFVMGPQEGLALVEKLGIGAVIVDANGAVLVSSRLQNRVHLGR